MKSHGSLVSASTDTFDHDCGCMRNLLALGPEGRGWACRDVVGDFCLWGREMDGKAVCMLLGWENEEWEESDEDGEYEEEGGWRWFRFCWKVDW